MGRRCASALHFVGTQPPRIVVLSQYALPALAGLLRYARMLAHVSSWAGTTRQTPAYSSLVKQHGSGASALRASAAAASTAAPAAAHLTVLHRLLPIRHLRQTLVACP